MPIQVSVILPVYNVERFLDACITSLSQQTLHELEFIFIDDCSPDQSAKIIQRFAKADNRCVFLRQDSNQGQGAARNRGVREARGRYIFFLDPDDLLYDKDSLLRLYECAERTGDDLIIGNVAAFSYDGDPNGKLEPMFFSDILQTYKSHTTLKKTPELLKCNNVWNKLFRKSYLIDKNIWHVPPRYAEDMLFALYSAYYAESISLLPEYTMKYRRGRYLQAATPRKCIDAAHNLKTQLQFIRKDGDKELVRFIERKVVAHVSSSFEREFCSKIGPESTFEFFIYYKRLLSGIDIEAVASDMWRKDFVQLIQHGAFSKALRFIHKEAPQFFPLQPLNKEKQAFNLPYAYREFWEPHDDLHVQYGDMYSTENSHWKLLENMFRPLWVTVFVLDSGGQKEREQTLQSIKTQEMGKTVRCKAQVIQEGQVPEIGKRHLAPQVRHYICVLRAGDSFADSKSLQHLLRVAEIQESEMVIGLSPLTAQNFCEFRQILPEEFPLSFLESPRHCVYRCTKIRPENWEKLVNTPERLVQRICLTHESTQYSKEKTSL